jgi:DNA gyrase subunit A
VRDIRMSGRATQGVRLQGLEEGDRVAAVTAVVTEDEEETGGETPPPEAEGEGESE